MAMPSVDHRGHPDQPRGQRGAHHQQHPFEPASHDAFRAHRRHEGDLATRVALEPTVRDILGLDVEPAPRRRVAEGVPRLRATALAVRGMRPPRFAGLFEAIANVVPMTAAASTRL